LNPRPSPCEGDVRSAQSSCLPGWTTGPTRWPRKASIFHLSKRENCDEDVLAEKPNVRALRILFDESKQGNASSSGLLNLHKSPGGELERCDCQLLFRDSGPENFSWYYDHVSCLGQLRHLSQVEDDSCSSRFTQETRDC
jgi:hypothetical protein